jgi:hypothetical protein
VRILPRADVRLVAEKFRIPEEALADSVTDTIIVDIAVSEVDLAQAIVPGQAFAQKKNLQLSFPASLTKEVAEKARGTITIYNAHSSEPQALVKTTRFETSDGKVYRLVDGITVPGAKIEDGKVIPSSITATVIADKAGSEYNIGAVQKFTIPGFKGSPKYETFYASSDAPMQGGFIGTVASPSETDLVNAKEIMEEELQKTLRNFMLAQLPNEFMLVDGAEMFRIVSHTVVPEQASADMFSLLSEAEMSITVFREADVLAMLEKKSESQAAVAYDVREHSLAYSVAAFADGALSVPVQYSATLARTIDTEILIEQMRGKSEDEVKTVIFGIPGLDSAEVSLWPFWVRRIPDDPEKIRVHVD